MLKQTNYWYEQIKSPYKSRRLNIFIVKTCLNKLSKQHPAKLQKLLKYFN